LGDYALTASGLDTIMVGDYDIGRLLWGKSLNEAGEWVISPWKLSARLLVVCSLILAIGRYKVLDRIMKVVVVLLSLTTLLALIFLLIGGIPEKTGVAVPFNWGDSAAIVAVIVPLVGWMPAPIDIAIWHSVWSIEKAKSDNKPTRLRDAMLDFRTGYWGTTLLAICFFAVGALVMYGSGQPIESSAGAFARQLIEMYTAALGDWARPVIAIAALTTMFSTTLTCLDAFPRVLKRATELFVPSSPALEKSNLIYWIWIVVVAGGASYVLANHLQNLLAMVDLATTLSFLTAPLLALFNVMAVNGKDMPLEARPGIRLRILSYLGLVFLFGFAAYYFWVRFG
jgi:Mn2+/Fe2+ NRAMP family transporter